MGMKRKKRAPRRRGWLLGSSATQVICISFVLLIALGTLLLTRPFPAAAVGWAWWMPCSLPPVPPV